MGTHKDLLVWQKSINFVTNVYETTRNFPKEELFCIVSQIRRAAISIPSNIAEGCARKSKNECIQFLYVALGSAAELETQIIISTHLNYLKKDSGGLIIAELQEIIRMITSLIKSLQKKI